MDGKLVSQSVKEKIKADVSDCILNGMRPPHLAAIIVGNHAASETYIASKEKSCAEAGFKSTLIRLSDHVSESALIDCINELNQDDIVDGILVQLPLPEHIHEQTIISTISPDKDVDGFHPVNTGKMIAGAAAFIPATPLGIMMMLEHYNIPTKGKHAVVIGRSNIVGRPISILLNQPRAFGNCTVTICHSQTSNLSNICREADILIAALGKPNFVTADMIKENAVVIDVGIHRMPDPSKKSGYSIVGDVDFENVAPLCSYITPVPGGVGSMTIAALLHNTYQSYRSKHTA